MKKIFFILLSFALFKSYASEELFLTQKDGKKLKITQSNNGVIVSRHDSNGDADITYAVNGLTILPQIQEITSAQLDKEDNLTVYGKDNNGEKLIVKLEKDGQIDTNFGVNGVEYVQASTKMQVAQTMSSPSSSSR